MTLLVLCAASLLCACSAAADVAEPTLTTVGSSTSATAAPDEGSDQAESDDEAATPTTETAAVSLAGPLTATVIATYPHDGDAFTQGLEVYDGQFVEGTGLYGESERRLVDIESGQPLLTEPIDPALFGEGITVVDDEILQLTWKAGVLIRSDVATLAEVGRDTYEGEGWGLCFDGESLAMSNGSSTLTYRDPETFAVTGSVDVTLDGEPVERLNELECVNGQIIANVWLIDLIVVIDPTTGEVVATLDGALLRPDELAADDSSFALNGIAHDPDTGHFFIIGKLWPVIYEVELS